MTTDHKFWKSRFAAEGLGIRTVGRHDRSVEQNKSDYAIAAECFKTYVKTDIVESDRKSALELGYGLGHYAKLCHSLGFVNYVGLDFAAPPGPPLGANYVYRQGDVGEHFDLGRTFDLVMAIDVLFHITDDLRFEVALENIRRHASGVIYVTGIPEDRRIAAHVVHRELDRFRSLGTLIGVSHWRDTSIMRFRVNSQKLLGES